MEKFKREKMMFQTLTLSKTIRVFFAVAICLAAAGEVFAQQLDQNCIVGILNRTIQVNADGSWVLPNVPAGFGRVRARATCVNNGVTTFGQSDFFSVVPNGNMDVPPIPLGAVTPVPASLTITAGTSTLNQLGATTQLRVIGTFPDNSTRDLTASSTGTAYTVSNPALASVSPDGLISARQTGTVLISAINEGTPAYFSLQISLSVDSDGDGIPDDAEIRLGLNPHDPTDAGLDFDHDGLTNLQEYRLGTDIRNPDTDGDGLTDGQEVNIYHTNPLVADTDGDGIPDGIEVQTGSNPLDPRSGDLSRALAGITVTPTNFTLIVNSIVGTAYTQLNVTGRLIDGHSTVDLTSTTRGTTYSSSNIQVCNFGSPDGRVFAGNEGSCTVTVAVGGFTSSVTGTVRNFTPTLLSYLSLPGNGFANKIAVQGNYAYIADGSAGLVIASISDHANPAVVSTLPVPGNQTDVKIVGNYAYLAAGSSGLQIVDVSNPQSPRIVGSLGNIGTTYGISVRSTIAYIAGSSGLTLVNIANPAAPITVATIATTGGTGAQALDIDTTRNLAVAALGTNGLDIFNVANPASPARLSHLAIPGGSTTSVKLTGNFAILGDINISMTSVDLTTPATPAILNSTQLALGGRLHDVALSQNFALGADVYFPNGVPIVDVSDPHNLIPRQIVNLTQAPGNRADAGGQGIAVDSSYFYVVTVNGSTFQQFGTTGDSRLYIGQYLPLIDLAGVPPTSRITAPANGSTHYQGETVTITDDARDDVAVAAVRFNVNGQDVYTSTSAPYQYNYQLPATGSTAVFKVTAVDLAGSTGVDTVSINVIPDPLTTVTGTVVDSNGAGIVGATVSTTGGITGTTTTGGAFTLPGVSTVTGNIVVNATFTPAGGQPLTGSSAPVAPVRGGTTIAGAIRALSATFETSLGTQVINCDDCSSLQTLPFPFTYFGNTYNSAYVGSNGYLTFNNPDSTYVESLPSFTNTPRISGFFDDLVGSVKVNNQLPGKFVVTYDHMYHYYAGGSDTIQITLFQDGRILFGYNGITSLNTGTIVGLTPGPGSNSQSIDYRNQTTVESPSATGIYDYFNGTNLFNLDHSFILYTPRPSGGYGVNVILPVVAGNSGTVTTGAPIVPTGGVSGGSPFANAQVEIRSSGNPAYHGYTNTNAVGSFTLGNVPPGGISVVVSVKGTVVGQAAGILSSATGSQLTLTIVPIPPTTKTSPKV